MTELSLGAEWLVDAHGCTPALLRSREVSYDVTPDGKRFLVASQLREPSGPIRVVLNWAADLRH